MTTPKINCWQYKKCGREPGGCMADKDGICPAAAETALNTFNNGVNAGRSCWLVAGTFCDQQIMGTFAEKIDTCKNCSFYQRVQEEEHSFDTTQGNLTLYAATHIGLVKKANEDRYYFKRFADNTLLFAVADGLGGQAAGDYAAEILRGKLANMPLIAKGMEEEVLAALAVETDRFILAAAERDTALEGMGTTLLCVFIREGRASWVHVGDSRLSIYRRGILRQLTEDQNLARYLVEEGEITPEEVADHYSRNILDQALGSLLDSPETGSVELDPGDILLLSTDGFHNLVLPEQIVAELMHSTDLKSTTDFLVKSALKRGGMDNITLIMAKYSPA
ncbi:MAG: protein phosphatase 2C domain-containing protein [Desulforhopalus sp.]|nr:protein phosphatase 2C domain-containing protein [Desulforhopalus sp.]